MQASVLKSPVVVLNGVVMCSSRQGPSPGIEGIRECFGRSAPCACVQWRAGGVHHCMCCVSDACEVRHADLAGVMGSGVWWGCMVVGAVSGRGRGGV